MPALEMLLRPVVSSILLPILLMIMGGLAKRGLEGPPWKMRHWDFSLELTFTSFSISMVMLLERTRFDLGLTTNLTLPPEKLSWFAVPLFVTILTALLYVIFYPQYFPDEPAQTSPADPIQRAFRWMNSFIKMLFLNMLGFVPIALAMYIFMS